MPNVYETTDAAANTGTTYTLNMGDFVHIMLQKWRLLTQVTRH